MAKDGSTVPNNIPLQMSMYLLIVFFSFFLIQLLHGKDINLKGINLITKQTFFDCKDKLDIWQDVQSGQSNVFGSLAPFEKFPKILLY